MATSPLMEKDESQTEMGDVHTSYMGRLQEWQKVCNFHYSLCWQYHGTQMIRSWYSTSPAATNPVSVSSSTLRQQNVVADPPSRAYKVASIPSRILAEFVDFMILLVCKTLLLMSYRYLSDAKSEVTYKFSIVNSYIDEDVTLDELRSLMLMELFYRLLASLYEAKFIAVFGATPGKMLVGIKVVACRMSASVNNGTSNVIVFPGSKLQAGSSWIRSLLKNFSITFVVPVFLSMLLYQHHRATYDVVSNSIVVKDERSTVA